MGVEGIIRGCEEDDDGLDGRFTSLRRLHGHESPTRVTANREPVSQADKWECIAVLSVRRKGQGEVCEIKSSDVLRVLSELLHRTARTGEV